MKILEILFYSIDAVTTVMLLYHIVILIAGWIASSKNKKPLADAKKMRKFCVLTSARNESKVIGELLDSLRNQDYPREMFDIFVIADNCTDDTADVAISHGAGVFIRNDKKHVGKGYALNYFFDRINKMRPNYYDAFCIFDADNIADKSFLTEMNKMLDTGAMVIQGKRDITNPTETWISGSYSVYFRFIINAYTASRDALGISGIAGGTGFVFDASLVKDGWHTKSITEDSEFSIQCILKGHRVRLCKTAVFYDEQPTTFKQSLRQRYRWSSGSIDCCGIFIKDLFKRLFDKDTDGAKRMTYIDTILFLLMIPITAILSLRTVIGILIQALSATPILTIIDQQLLGFVMTFLGFVVMAVLVTKLYSKNTLRSMWKAIVGYPIFCIVWMYINIVALIKRERNWAPIDHKGKRGAEG